MNTSLIIPVWNGESVIRDCLQALYQHSDFSLCEVICVDNGSADQSASLILQHFPHVRLLSQPINLGFAGGVNAGLRAAQGDLLILLNQDCMVEPNWLPPIQAALAQANDFGIVGCTILNADDTINHAGARLKRPSLYGEHLTELPPPHEAKHIQPMEFVTGAVFAIRRATWEAVGELDAGFYPAYYEETDYCYRARRKGILTGYVAASQARHLFSSRQWQVDPVRHTANQHQSRYRFAVKHLNQAEIQDFMHAELVGLEQEVYFDQAIGRVLAARHTLRTMPAIAQQRVVNLAMPLTATERQQFESGFAQVIKNALLRASQLAGINTSPPQPSSSQADYQADLQNQVQRLLTRIYFHPPHEVPEESRWQRLLRQYILRPLSILSGRDALLQAKVGYLNTLRIESILAQQAQQQEHYQQELAQLKARFHFLETLTAYDYR